MNKTNKWNRQSATQLLLISLFLVAVVLAIAIHYAHC